MAERTIAAVLILLFAVLFYDASSEILRLFASRDFGGVPVLLFCATVCVGWIAFLAALALAGAPAHGLKWQGPRGSLPGPLPHA